MDRMCSQACEGYLRQVECSITHHNFSNNDDNVAESCRTSASMCTHLQTQPITYQPLVPMHQLCLLPGEKSRAAAKREEEERKRLEAAARKVGTLEGAVLMDSSVDCMALHEGI